MKESFKKGFGTVIGIWAGAVVAGAINELMKPKTEKNEAGEKPAEENSKEEEESN